MSSKLAVTGLSVALFLGAGSVSGESSQQTNVLRKAAIIVSNRAGSELDDKVDVLEDLVANGIAGDGFAIISRNDVAKALGGDATGLGQALDDQSSALRLAQNLGADFVVMPSISSLDHKTVDYKGEGIVTQNTTYTLRLGYRILEAGQGGALDGGTVTASKTIRQSAGVRTQDGGIVNDLLNDAAQQLVAKISSRSQALPITVAKAQAVSFEVACTMTDPRQQPIWLPSISLGPDETVVTNAPIAVQAMDVTVELDGVALGSAPGAFKAKPGLHTIRLSREGFNDWERTINVYDGQTLRVALQMSDEAFVRWAETTDFLFDLDNERKLTDAEVKRIEGIATFFSESHYRVNVTNINTVYKSLY